MEHSTLPEIQSLSNNHDKNTKSQSNLYSIIKDRKEYLVVYNSIKNKIMTITNRIGMIKGEEIASMRKFKEIKKKFNKFKEIQMFKDKLKEKVIYHLLIETNNGYGQNEKSRIE